MLNHTKRNSKLKKLPLVCLLVVIMKPRYVVFVSPVLCKLMALLDLTFYIILSHLQSKFVDDDNVTHMEWNWSFDIKKDW